MSDTGANKYRAAIEVLQRGRDVLIDALADDVLDQAEDLVEGGFLFNEFLEGQGTRLHFLSLLVSQLEQSAEALDEVQTAPPPPPPAPEPPTPKKRKPRAKKLQRQAAPESQADDS